MNALSPNLLDTDFKQLVELARARLPQSAPGWTDHNLHDPGIMLIELLAWITEAQIYSVARVRNDERWAFGSLFGLAPRGPLGASGMAWPVDDADSGALLAPAGAILTGLPQVPEFCLPHAINITGAKLAGVQTRLHDGRVLDHTAANACGDRGFYPFGPASHPDDRLVLAFAGSLLASKKSRDAYLSIGVRVDHGDAGASAAAPQGPCMSVTLLAGGHVRVALPVHSDGTAGFTRSGVLLLGLRQVPHRLDGFEIAFGASGFPAARRILCIRPNALPMQQRRHRTEEVAPGSAGLPDQSIGLHGAGICFPESAPVVKVRAQGREEQWQDCADLSQAEPGDAVYRFDAERGRIQFGNGINGRIPPSGAMVTVDYDICDGAAGNLNAGLPWTLRGGAGHQYTNPERTTGGAPALDLAQLRRLARTRVRQAHPIVTARDLEDAALDLAGLRVVRVHSLAARPARPGELPADRLLVALRERPAADAPAGPAESRHWLQHVRRALAPRVLLGERLRVVAPDYVPVRVEATLVLRQGVDPVTVRRGALDMLAAYFKLVDGAGGPVWPFGRPVRLLDLTGRLLRVDGVSGVASCALFGGDLPGAREVVDLKPTGLPLFQRERSILTVAVGKGPA